MKFLKKFSTLISLLLVCSCIYLSKWSITHYNESKYVISVMKVRILYNGELQKKSNGLGNWCRINFTDGSFDSLKHRNKDNVFYYLVKSNPGIVRFKRLKCRKHIIPYLILEKRRIYLDRWVFDAKPGYINYVGDLTIDYRPHDFMVADIFSLGALKPDYGGSVNIIVNDNINDVRRFLNTHYPEFRNKQILRSFPYDPAQEKFSKTITLPPVPVAMPGFGSHNSFNYKNPEQFKSQNRQPNTQQNKMQNLRQNPAMRNPGYYQHSPQQHYNQNYYGRSSQVPQDNDKNYQPSVYEYESYYKSQ